MLDAILLAALFILSALAASTSSVHTDAHAVTCQSFSISWVGGVAPFNLTLQDAAAPEPPLESVTQTDNSFVWIPNVPAGTTVLLQVNDSGGTLAQKSSFNVQKGTDTSCVVQANTSSGANLSGTTTVASSTGSTSSTGLASPTPSSVSAPISSPLVSSSVSPTASSSSTSSSGSTTSTSLKVSGGRKVAIAAPISVFLIVLVLLFLLVLWVRKRRHRETSALDPETIAGQSSPSSSSPSGIDPFSQSTSPTQYYSSEKGLPALPIQPQVTAEELQNAIDRIQEMYAILRQTQSSSANAGDDGRVIDLQRQIQDLMADNAVLSGESPPDYDSEPARV
ncbi:hypothetical protein FB451DRAFT_1209118 [Mycena latifolia]|nr:hypothetical protein FB451DRAFT_1209118 [Mycena latifolia]